MLDIKMPKYFFSKSLKGYEEVFKQYGLRCELIVSNGLFKDIKQEEI